MGRQNATNRSTRQTERVRIRFQGLFDCDRDSTIGRFVPRAKRKVDATTP
jgi:hypothetical protein